ncbi:MAG: hypothetical protein K2I25_00815, partial [Muribaculaceae bacterium]|nr:hypothetical protein [Muribaculaceae bacterium]
PPPPFFLHALHVIRHPKVSRWLGYVLKRQVPPPASLASSPSDRSDLSDLSFYPTCPPPARLP